MKAEACGRDNWERTGPILIRVLPPNGQVIPTDFLGKAADDTSNNIIWNGINVWNFCINEVVEVVSKRSPPKRAKGRLIGEYHWQI